jgi:PAS domain S-box-containing protein
LSLRAAENDIDESKRRAASLKVQGGFGVALACLVVVAVVSWLSTVRLNETRIWVDHTREVIRRLDSLLTGVTDIQNGYRGFAITGDETYLEPYLQAVKAVADDAAHLHELTADNPGQQQLLARLSRPLDAQVQYGQEIIEARRNAGFDMARGLVLSGKGKQLHDQLHRQIREIKHVEATLLRTRELAAGKNSLIAQAVIIGGSALAFVFVALALVAMRRDFAARQRAEAQLDRFFQLSLDFLCIASVDGYFKRVSPAVTDILGWSVTEFLSSPYLDFVHPEDLLATERSVERQVQAGEKVMHFENRYRHKDGSWRVLSWRSIPQPDGLMYATARDVTELKLAEQALRGSNEQLERRVQERTADLAQANEALLGDVAERKRVELRLQAQMARLALLSQITRAIGERQDNHSIFQVVVGTLEEQLPVDFACLCLYEPAANALTVVNVGTRSATLATELALTERARVTIDENGLSQCLRGSLVYEADLGRIAFPFPQRLHAVGLGAMVAAPLLTESKVFGILIAARREPDSFSSGECEFLQQLSEHVALAAHQAGLHGSLQTAYDDLRQTQQAVMQQERLRVLGQMASGIAHDINNAISPITLYTESLLESEPNLSERTRSYLQTIQRAISDVAETVTRMREFYRQREQQTALVPVQLNALVPQVVELTRARWADMPQQRGCVIQLRTQLAASLPQIMGVESEIREALTNLIFNAVDAMPEGGTLTVRTSVKEGAKVDLEVSDTGVGMDEETRRRCLELFFTTKGERGSGLGLATVYGMVQRHGAEIRIESEPAKGTTMHLSFDVPREVTSAAAAAIYPAATGLRILIVDDDPVLLKSLRDTLEHDGHVIVTANGGQQGIDMLKGTPGVDAFDIVITDLGMPSVDGRKVAAAVKAASPSTPVLMLTGWGQRLVTEGDTPEHVDRVLGKPPRLRELRTALAELVGPGAKNPA